MRKSAIATGVAVAALGMAAATTAQAGILAFNGPFAPANWTSTISGTPVQGSPLPGNEQSAFSASNTVLTLVGGDAGCTSGAGTCELRFTTTNIENPF